MRDVQDKPANGRLLGARSVARTKMLMKAEKP